MPSWLETGKPVLMQADSKIPSYIQRQLRLYPTLDAAEEVAVTSATWLARREAWSIVLADPTARARAVAVLEALDRVHKPRHKKAGPIKPKQAAEARALLDALSAGDVHKIAVADKDDVALRASAAVLSGRDERAVAACLRRVDAAVAKIERHNIAFVYFIVRRYFGNRHNSGASIELDDLIGWGIPGLRTAALRFRPETGYKFGTYATMWIRHAIGRALDDHSHAIRVPVHMLQTAAQVRHAAADLRERGEDFDDESIAASTGKTASAVRKALEAGNLNADPTRMMAHSVHSRDDDDLDDFTACRADASLPDEDEILDAMDERVAMADVSRAMGRLSESRRFVVEGRVGMLSPDGRAETLQELGDALGLSRERARQIYFESIRLLQKDLAGRARGSVAC